MELVQCCCRICMLKNAPKMDSIYSQHDDLLIVDIIHLLVPDLHISINDNLSDKVCEICKNNLVTVFNEVCKIRELCLRTDQEMKSIIAIVEHENRSEILDNYSSNNVIIISENGNHSLNTLMKSDECKNNDSLMDEAAVIKFYKCNECNKEFTKKGSLSSHMKSHKERKHKKLAGELVHVCDVCNKGFQQLCTLKDHLRTHSGETPFLCPECGKAFNNSSNLRQHRIRHSGQKPYTCDQCPSKFSCKAGLTSHKETHTGVKPYVCDVCGSAFTKTYALAKHKRIHTGEKPYICVRCPMKFNSSDHLKRHMRTHTGEKPYKCRFCIRSFAQSNDLVKHIRCHVGKNTYQCNECESNFRLASELKAHIRHHFLEQQNNSNSQDINENENVSNGNNIIEDEKSIFTELGTLTSPDNTTQIYNTNSASEMPLNDIIE